MYSHLVLLPEMTHVFPANISLARANHKGKACHQWDRKV